MTNEFAKKLNEEISRVQSDIVLAEPNSGEYQTLVDRLNDLCKVRNEYQRTKAEQWEKFLGLGLSLGTAIVTFALTNRWYQWGFEFEKNGALTSTTFRDIRGGRLLKMPIFRK